MAVEAVQAEQIAEHGGLPGIRDEGLLEAALARPQHQWAYREHSSLASLAAAYAFGMARNHPFRDGNKRIAFLTALMFLGLNGKAFAAADAEVVMTMVALAAGDLTEAKLTKWFQAGIVSAT
jgi:death-on-curing protein